MKLTELADDALLSELGSRVRAQRIRAQLTQAELAEQAGIGKRTLERLEDGGRTEVLTLVRVLRVLDGLEGFEPLLPATGPGPIAKLKARGGTPKRVRHARNAGAKDKDGGDEDGGWSWGEDR